MFIRVGGKRHHLWRAMDQHRAARDAAIRNRREVAGIVSAA